MKISASVPDDLWDAARRAANADSTSALVQAALTQLVEKHEQARAYAEPPELTGEVRSLRDAARTRLVADGRARFGHGYEQGVRLAADLDWAQIAHLVEHGAAVTASQCSRLAAERHTNTRTLPEGARAVIDPQVLVPYLGAIADWTGSTEWSPDEVSVEGIDRALRDLWDDVRSTPTSP